MSGRKDVGLVITAYIGITILVLLVIVFWVYFLVAGLVGLMLWLAWRTWPQVSWWLTIGRVHHQTGRAMEQNTAAYKRARARMERIARRYRNPK